MQSKGRLKGTAFAEADQSEPTPERMNSASRADARLDSCWRSMARPKINLRRSETQMASSIQGTQSREPLSDRSGYSRQALPPQDVKNDRAAIRPPINTHVLQTKESESVLLEMVLDASTVVPHRQTTSLVASSEPDGSVEQHTEAILHLV